MKFLVLVLFGGGFLVLTGIALPFLLRFLLLQWAVGLIGSVAQSILKWIGDILYACISIFGVALVGAIIVGLSLQIGMILANHDPNGVVNSTIPILAAFLSFFVIVAMRSWQWNGQRDHARRGPLTGSEVEFTKAEPIPVRLQRRKRRLVANRLAPFARWRSTSRKS